MKLPKNLKKSGFSSKNLKKGEQNLKKFLRTLKKRSKSRNWHLLKLYLGRCTLDWQKNLWPFFFFWSQAINCSLCVNFLAIMYFVLTFFQIIPRKVYLGLKFSQIIPSNVYLGLAFAQIIPSKVYLGLKLKLYLARCISDGHFLKLYLARCISDWYWNYT